MVFSPSYNWLSMAVPDTLPAVVALASVPPGHDRASWLEPDGKRNERPDVRRSLGAAPGLRLCLIDRPLPIRCTAEGLIDVLPEGPLQILPAADCRSDTPAVDCAPAGEMGAQVAVHHSRAKMTIRNNRLAACSVHAQGVSEESR